MGRVIYSMNVSLDGYYEDADGSIDFSVPAEDVHRSANEQTRKASAFLFGRRLYETMEQPWTELAARPDELSAVAAEFAELYFATPRFVFSDTLAPDSLPEGVQLVRSKDAVAEVTRLKREFDSELDLGGGTLAAALLDLIDEFRLYVTPVALGGGKPYFPPGRRLSLRLIEQQPFDSGPVLLRYERAAE